MRKFGLVLLLSLFAVTSCGNSNDDFLNEFAITSYGNNNLTSKLTVLNNVSDSSIINSNFINAGGDYISILSGERIYGDNFGSTKIGDHYLYHSSYIIPYDGSESYHVDVYDVVMATDSSLFMELTEESEVENIELVVIKVYEIYIDGYEYYAFFTQGDSVLSASNIFPAQNVYIHKDNLDSYEYLSKTSILHRDSEGNLIQYNYSKNNYNYDGSLNTNVEYMLVEETENIEGITILSLYFPNTYYEYSYVVESVDGITNDFTYVLDGQRYKATIYNGGTVEEENINYFPLLYRTSKDGSKVVILCKKIGEDGVLSNKYYTFILSSDGKRTDFSEDVFLFTEEGLETSIYASFKGNRKVFEDEEKLLYLDEDLCVVLRDERYINLYTENFEKIKLVQDIPYRDFNYSSILTFPNLIDDHLMIMVLPDTEMIPYSENRLLYIDMEFLKDSIKSDSIKETNGFMNDTIRFTEVFDSQNCIYFKDNGDYMDRGLYFGATKICSYDSETYTFSKFSRTIMGKTQTSYLISDSRTERLTLFNVTRE